MASAPDPAKSVVLSLTPDGASGANLQIPERRIILYPGHLNISIGRASKDSRKGFVAAKDNGWFDSPVMSRLHARLSATMDEKKIQIRDLGSLHGTFVNDNDRVPKDHSYEVKDGDLLRFGAPIWRGTEQFIPTTVRVGVQFPNRDGTFQVPDGSDDEGTDDQVIDLTTNQWKRETHAIIDLSTPSSPGHVNSNSEPAENHVGSPDITLDSHLTGSPAGYFMKPPGPIDVPGGGIAPAPAWHPLQAEEHWSGETDDEDESELSADYESGYSDDENESNLEIDEEDNDSSPPVYDEDPKMGSEDELESEDTGSMSAEPLGGKLTYLTLNDTILRFPVDPGAIWDRVPYCPNDFPEIMPLVESLSTLPAPLPSLRQPSVGWALSGGMQQSSCPHPLPTDSPTSMELAESLGAKIGKSDFFLAREENKATLEKRSTQARPTSVQDLCNQDDSVDVPSHYSFGPAEQAIMPEKENANDIPQLEPDFSATPIAPALPQTISDEVPKGLKRKADEISEEQEQWAAAEDIRVALESSLVNEEDGQQQPSVPEPPVAIQEATENVEDSPKAAGPTTERPAKKKRILDVAERLGYAALGGVTAGAMIVGTLIYTAPTFA
ncbi:hypothetical protein B0J18DRAFT_158616 [Chaetomium sp. MPI-SDFR-AT-0129]|nr:hypothetical protein B0J18DRAFT_158616 [Chaetomium sp. MPI-SDFR-AT-0129]